MISSKILSNENIDEYLNLINFGAEKSSVRSFLLKCIADDAIIYKYFRGNDRDLHMIERGNLWASSSYLQNDPFDSLILPNCRRKERYDSTNPIEVEQAIFDEKQQRIAEKDAYERQKHTYCVSFSERNDSTLMWSHYANNHYGVCLGYNLKDILEKKDIFPINYDDTYSPQASIMKRVLTKSKAWSYENEWRIIDTSAKFMKGMEIDHFSPCEILIGVRTGEIPPFKEKYDIKEYASLASWWDYANHQRIPILFSYKKPGEKYDFEIKAVQNMPV